MTHVPEQVKGIARTGVLRLALEKGHSVITSAVIDEAMDRFMPKSASAATKALAEAVALERAKSGPVSMCRSCGVAATQSGAVKCTVCGATDFEVISQEMIEKIAAVEGGLEEETTYDGRKLRWSEDARKGLWTMKNAYQRRRVKARVEKRARMMKLDAITLDFARQVIEEETGAPLEIQGRAAHIPESAARGGRGEARGPRRQEEPADLDVRVDRRGRAEDPSGPGGLHAEQDAGADRGACARARRHDDRSRARRGRYRNRQEDDGGDDRDLQRSRIGRHEARGCDDTRARERQRRWPWVSQRGEPAHRARLSAYRFCRTDDIGLLVDALNRCWAPYYPDEPPVTPAAFKRSIRDLQVWCSSCMVAFSGSDPIGVLIGAKRLSSTLVHKIAVHPDHRRQGHGRHLLTSLGSKLAILGPPRIVAEVPETLVPARELFAASGYVEEARLTDYVLDREANDVGEAAGMFVIPVTIDDLAANGLLGEAHLQVCWERSVETLTARKDDIAGLAVASDERIEAYVLYVTRGMEETEIVSLRSFIDDGGARLKQLLSRLRARGTQTFRFPKVHPAEISKEWLKTLGFSPAGGHLLYAARAQSA